MNNLYTFGCSFTDDYGVDGKTHNYKVYKEFKGGVFPKIWNELLSEELGMNLINCGEGGSGNDYIFQKFCDNLHSFDSQDIVIVQWSYNSRFKKNR